MSRLARLVAVILLAAVSAGCLSTQIRDSWVAPDADTPMQIDRAIIVFIDPDERSREAAEDALVARLGSDRAVASHTMFSNEQIRDTDDQEHVEALRREVQAAGIDGAVVMRLVDEQERLNYSVGMAYPVYYGGFYPYYGYGWGNVYGPAYVTSNTVVSAETNIYDLDADELVWSGITETFNPDSIRSMVTDIAEAVIHELRNRRLLDVP